MRYIFQYNDKNVLSRNHHVLASGPAEIDSCRHR